MSLDFYLYDGTSTTKCYCDCGHLSHHKTERNDVFEANITHNVAAMFKEAGAYEILWHGDGKSATEALPILKEALRRMQSSPEHFAKFNASNGWGTYEQSVSWLKSVIEGCEYNPFALIYCSR